MKDYKPTRYIFDGDVAKARTIVGDGNRLLFQLKNIQQAGAPDIKHLENKYSDGVIVMADTSIYGIDLIKIFVPPVFFEQKGSQRDFPIPIILDINYSTYDANGGYVAKEFIGFNKEYVPFNKDGKVEYNKSNVKLEELERVGTLYLIDIDDTANNVFTRTVTPTYSLSEYNDDLTGLSWGSYVVDRKSAVDIFPSYYNWLMGQPIANDNYWKSQGKTSVYGYSTTSSDNHFTYDSARMIWFQYFDTHTDDVAYTTPENYYGFNGFSGDLSGTIAGEVDKVTTYNLSGYLTDTIGTYRVYGSGSKEINFGTGAASWTVNYNAEGGSYWMDENAVWEKTGRYIYTYIFNDATYSSSYSNSTTYTKAQITNSYDSIGVFATPYGDQYNPDDWEETDYYKVATDEDTFIILQTTYGSSDRSYYYADFQYADIFDYKGKPFYMYSLYAPFYDNDYNFVKEESFYEYGCIFKRNIFRIRIGMNDDEWTHNFSSAKYTTGTDNPWIDFDGFPKEMESMFGDGEFRAGKYTVVESGD